MCRTRDSHILLSTPRRVFHAHAFHCMVSSSHFRPIHDIFPPAQVGAEVLDHFDRAVLQHPDTMEEERDFSHLLCLDIHRFRLTTHVRHAFCGYKIREERNSKQKMAITARMPHWSQEVAAVWRVISEMRG